MAPSWTAVQISWLGVILLAGLPNSGESVAVGTHHAPRDEYHGVRHPYSRGAAGALHSTSLKSKSGKSAASTFTQSRENTSVLSVYIGRAECADDTELRKKPSAGALGLEEVTRLSQRLVIVGLDWSILPIGVGGTRIVVLVRIQRPAAIARH